MNSLIEITRRSVRETPFGNRISVSGLLPIAGLLFGATRAASGIKNIYIPRLAAGIACCCMLLAGIQPMECQAHVAMHLLPDSSIVLVPVIVDGQGPFTFILDTGADDVILDSSLARKLALRVSGDARQGTILGAWEPDRSMAKSLQLGPEQMQDAPVLLTDLSGLRSQVPGVQGILGQSFLSHFNYLLDYQNRSLRFEQNEEIRESLQGQPLPSVIVGQRIFILAHAQTAGSAPLRLLLDSGANALVLSRASADAIHLVLQGERLATTVNDKVVIPFGQLEQLTLGSRLLRHLPVTVSTAHQMRAVCDGLLPASLFKAIYINNTEGFIEIPDVSRQTSNGGKTR
jgi:predicted aspartyl protease